MLDHQAMTASATKIPTMVSEDVLEYIELIGALWTGRGVAVECGSWLGRSFAHLCDGLQLAGYDRVAHSFDRFEANPDEVAKAAAQGVELRAGQDTSGLFLDNVKPHYPGVRAHRGRIERAEWCGDPIEIFLIDAAKREAPFKATLQTFGPSFIPGVTVIGLMDFNFHRKKAPPENEPYLYQRRMVESLGDRLEVMRDWVEKDPAFFRYAGEVDWRAEL